MSAILSLLILSGVSVAAVFGEGQFTSPRAKLEQILANPGEFEGKKVVVEGRVREVCQRLGCWLKIAAGKSEVRIVTKDHAFFVPKTLKGKTVKAEGVLTQVEEKIEFIADAISIP